MRTDQVYAGSGDELVLAVSLELAAAKWKVALHDGRREKPSVHMVAQPQAAARLQGIGGIGASRLALELFWRDFNNRREVGACVGLVPQPYKR